MIVLMIAARSKKNRKNNKFIFKIFSLSEIKHFNIFTFFCIQISTFQASNLSNHDTFFNLQTNNNKKKEDAIQLRM